MYLTQPPTTWIEFLETFELIWSVSCPLCDGTRKKFYATENDEDRLVMCSGCVQTGLGQCIQNAEGVKLGDLVVYAKSHWLKFDRTRTMFMWHG